MLKLVRRSVILGCLLLLLTGCTVPNSTGASTQAGASSSPHPSADAATVTTVILGAAGLSLLDATGDSTGSWGWFDGSDRVIAALTSAFGSAPTPVPYPGAIESAPGTDYTWDGFVLRVQDFTPTPPQESNLTVLSTSSRVGAVDIRLANGLSIGSTVADVVARGPAQSFAYTEPAGHTGYSFDPVKVDTADDGTALLNYVNVIGDGTDVIQIVAPGKNYGV